MVLSILVVDDDAAVRGLIVRILRSRGHAVVAEAGSGADALALPLGPAALLGVLAAFTLRLLSVARGWSAPRSPWSRR